MIGHDAIDPQVEQRCHPIRFVDRPDVDLQPPRVGRRARSAGRPPGCPTVRLGHLRAHRTRANGAGDPRTSAGAARARRACRTRWPAAGPRGAARGATLASEKEPTQTRSQAPVRRIRSTSGASAGSALTSTFQRASGELSSSSSKSGGGSFPADAGPAHLVPGEVRYPAPASVTRSSVASWKATSLPSDGGVYIGLEVAVAEAGRAAEGGGGVLHPVGGAAAMRERDRGRMVQIGVAYSGHRRSIARPGGPAATAAVRGRAGGMAKACGK